MSNELDSNGVVNETSVTPPASPQKKKRNRKPGSKGRSKAVKLTVPEGGFKTADEAWFSFILGKHAKLRDPDFADVLEAARFDVRYYQALATRAAEKAERIAATGSTPEERKAAAQTTKLVEGLAGAIQLGGLSASQLEQLQLLIATASAK